VAPLSGPETGEYLSGYFSGAPGLMGGCRHENPASPASPASSLAPFAINIISRCRKRGNIHFFPSRGFPSLRRRVYCHQYVFWVSQAWERRFFTITRLPRIPPPRSSPSKYSWEMQAWEHFIPSRPAASPAPLPPSRLFPSSAPPGSSTRGNLFSYVAPLPSRNISRSPPVYFT